MLKKRDFEKNKLNLLYTRGNIASNLIDTCSRSTVGPSVFNTPDLSYNKRHNCFFSLENSLR